MIDLRPVEKDYYGCNSCRSEIDIYWVTIGEGSNHISLKLCNECRIELMDKLKHVTDDN